MKKILPYLFILLFLYSFNSSAFGQCYSSEGTIMVNSIYICEGDAAIVDADDFLLIPGQSVYYVYHTNAAVSATNPPSSSEIVTLGSFLQNGASVSGTVYVTAFGASSDGAGGPDYSDPCLTVSNTIALNYLQPISISIEEDCDSGNGEFNYTFSISGGLPGVVPFSEYTVSGDYYNGPSGLSGSVTVGPITDGSSYSISVTDDNGCEATFSGSIECDKLPVELIEFSVSAYNSGHSVQWSTATEYENSHFTVYRSKDGLNYELLETIEGAGNSIESTHYSHFVEAPYAGVNYYKLIQTDYDGSVEELGIRSIISEDYTLEEIDIYPMPVEDNLSISYYSSNNSSAQIQIMDLKGSILLDISSESHLGINEFNTDIAGLSSGTYLVRILTHNGALTDKFIKN